MVDIVDYRHRWAMEFQAIAGRMRAGLGPVAVRIDHIGSTAVQGLAAKDVIDVQITVAALEETLTKRMATLGYAWAESIDRDHVPPGGNSEPDLWKKWFFLAPTGQRATNTHVRVSGRPNQVYPLLFRDYLRCHPATAAAYAELKRQLARELRDAAMYPDVKDPAVDLIYLAAIQWAAASGWRAGPSDA